MKTITAILLAASLVSFGAQAQESAPEPDKCESLVKYTNDVFTMKVLQNTRRQTMSQVKIGASDPKFKDHMYVINYVYRFNSEPKTRDQFKSAIRRMCEAGTIGE